MQVAASLLLLLLLLQKNSCNMMVISSLEISLLLQNLELSAAPICVVVDYSETC